MSPLLNLSSLGADTGVRHATAGAWLSVLEASYLAWRLPPSATCTTRCPSAEGSDVVEDPADRDGANIGRQIECPRACVHDRQTVQAEVLGGDVHRTGQRRSGGPFEAAGAQSEERVQATRSLDHAHSRP